MTELTALITRLKDATGPCRETDVLIHEAVHGQRAAPGHTPEYTASFEAAMSLVPEDATLDMRAQNIGGWAHRVSLKYWPPLGAGRRVSLAVGVSAAVAVCRAAMHARIAIETEKAGA
ncbi:hypothetical protein PQR05_29765 [Paraburkholderia sediminicola]|uniref:hypothetical protein n=1 Tax=Paraburkholderia sediminicola TaxID=458836 RepID=UPI0038B7221D